MIANKKVVHIADLRAEKAYADRDPCIVAGVELGGVRTVLMVPMLKETNSSVRSVCTAKKFGPSPTNRLHWCRTSPLKPSSPSRTRGCSTNYVSAPTTSPRR